MTERPPHTAILLSRSYRPDVRAEKQAHTLAAAGWRVSVLAWDREERLPVHACHDAPEVLAAALADWPERAPGPPQQVSVTHVQIPAGYRSGWRLLRRVPVFWWRVWQELRRLQPDVVHANDLDTLPVALLYGRLARVPVLLDVRDYYPGMVRASLGGAASRALEVLERVLVPRVDGVITVSEALVRRYRTWGVQTWLVSNAHALPDRDTLDARGRAFRRQLGVPDDALLVVYVGYLNPERMIAPILEAVPDLDNVWFVVGGTGPQLQAVQDASARCARIRALGWVPLHDVPVVVAASDVVYFGFEAQHPNSTYFSSNLTYFALGVGRPIVTTPVGESAALVRQTGAGIVLDRASAGAARKALAQLCDTAYRATLTEHARYNEIEQYHWLAAAGALMAAYRRVFRGSDGH